MKKSMSLMAMLLVIGLLAGCGDQTAQSTGSTGGSGSAASAAGSTSGPEGPANFNPTGFPIVNEPLTLKIWGPETAGNDYNTNVSTTEYEKMTGIHIEWDLFSSTMDANQAFNLLLTSNDLPDILSSSYSTEKIRMCMEGKVLTPLNDMIDQYGDSYRKALEQNPEYVDFLTAPDGNIYTLMYTDVGVHKDSEYKMWVKNDWLKALNMSAPTTPEEFKAMLKAFKEKDPNGNGQADELSLIGYFNGRKSDPICYLMNPFQLYNENYYYITDDGELKFIANTDGWREGLKYLNDLYESGLIEEETYVQDETQFKALLNKPTEEAIVGVFPNWFQGALIDSAVLDWTDYQAIAPLKGPTGLQQTAARKGGDFNLNGAVTTACKTPEAAFRWLEWFLSKDGNIFSQFGVEGNTYNWVDMPAYNGDARSIKTIKFDQPQIWNSGMVPRFDSADVRYVVSDDVEQRNIDNTYVLYSAAKIYEPFYVWHNLPKIIWCDDNAIVTKKTDYQVSFNDYIAATDTAFVLGNLDIENDGDWQNYLDTLNSMGLEDYLGTLRTYFDVK